MEATKHENGISFFFNKEEYDSLSRFARTILMLDIKEQGSLNGNDHAEPSNPFLRMRKNTISFLKDAKELFSDQWVDIHDPMFRDLRWQYRLTDVTPIIKCLHDKGFAEISINPKNNRLERFKLTF